MADISITTSYKLVMLKSDYLQDAQRDKHIQPNSES